MLHLAIDKVERVEIAIAGQMPAEVEQGDVGCAREIGEVFRDAIIERQCVLLVEHEQQAASELLRDRADREHRLRSDRIARLEVARAVAAREHDLAVLHHADRQSDDVLVDDRLSDDAVELRRVDGLLSAHGCAGGDQRERKDAESRHGGRCVGR